MKTRLLTAILLIVGLLGVLFFVPPRFFNIAIGVILCGALWEWSGLIFTVPRARYGYVVLGILLALAIYIFANRFAKTVLWGVELLYFFPVVFWVITYPKTASQWKSQFVKIFQSYLILLSVCSAILFLYTQKLGNFQILIILLLVIFADSGAYFVGRFLGKHLLLPSVSPKKTWEGLIGALLIPALLLLAMPIIFNGYHGLYIIAASILLLSLLSVIGDLFESMLKREAGVKDSGKLLPGHGGILDRIDGYLFVLPFCALYGSKYFNIC